MTLENLAAWKAYFWPNTEVLRNKLNIRDGEALAEAEALLTRVRMEQGVPDAPFTPAGYCSIHRHVFQDLYAWAGRYRTANMGHPNHAAFFCKPQFIAAQMDRLFAAIRSMPPTRTSDEFAAGYAESFADLNAIHPFREGNGRTMRIFIEHLARHHGLAFDQSLLDPDAWNDASRESFATGNPEPMRAVVLSALGAT